MSLIQLASVSFGFPGNELFSEVSWQISPGSRIGLVGPNGAGKSTLLALIAGEIMPDTGAVARAKHAAVRCLRQSQHFGEQGTLLDALLAPFADIVALRERLNALHAALEGHEGDSKIVEQYSALHDEYLHLGGYTLETRVQALAADLGFSQADLGRSVSTLSGGERGRLELGKVLISEPEVLLLDEPTNHLDVLSVERLEARLAGYPTDKAFVVVSHDRTFLQAVCTSIVDVGALIPGEIDFYAMRYDKYIVDRKERIERRQTEYTRQQGEISRQEDFIRRNIAGQKTKQAQSRRKMLAKLERITGPDRAWESAGRIGLRFAFSEHPGPKDAIMAKQLEVGFPGAEKPLINALDFIIYRGDRVGIVGDNGAGKTTLMRTLLGLNAAHGGLATLGQGVEVGYYDQKHGELDPERSLMEEIALVRPEWTPDPIRNYLARFRFFGDDVFRKVKGLSGGERSRLALGKMMLRPRNLLALDEPTNHLDIPATEVLEEALAAFEGTLIVVSHDRYFLDQVATKILWVEGGHAELAVGNYSEVRERRRQTARASLAPVDTRSKTQHQSPPKSRTSPPPSQRNDAKTPSPPETKEQRIEELEARRKKQRRREQAVRRHGELELEIARLETEQTALRKTLTEMSPDNWQELHTLANQESELGDRITSLMAEWAKLAEELEETRKW